jgi:hypothetical protein
MNWLFVSIIYLYLCTSFRKGVLQLGITAPKSQQLIKYYDINFALSVFSFCIYIHALLEIM